MKLVIELVTALGIFIGVVFLISCLLTFIVIIPDIRMYGWRFVFKDD